MGLQRKIQRLVRMSNKIKIVIDNKIPFIKGVLEEYAIVEYCAPSEIANEKIKDTDALIIRTRTKCNAQLLSGSSVKFIATATIGFDHINTEYCAANNIIWASAPGCNSSSVQQYIASALVSLAKKKNFSLRNKTIGIVGVGNVGSKVERLAKILGMKVLLNDPPRERSEGKEKFVSLDEIISNSDIITFHVPLNKTGEDKTVHIADEKFFEKFNNSKIIINSSRGPVVKTSALIEAMHSGKVSAAVLDVWENEPNIDHELLSLVDFATPHIAGYSADGKANGTSMSIHALNNFFNLGIKNDWYPSEIPSPPQPKEISFDCQGKEEEQILHECILSTYKISEDDQRLRNSVETFEKQRGDYPVRREFPYFTVKLSNEISEIKKKISELGFSIQQL